MTTSRWKTRAYSWIERILSSYTDVIVCVSEYERRMAEAAGISPGAIQVIYNGVERRIGARQGKDVPKRRKTDKLSAIFVGRLDRQKGFDVLIRALDLVARDRWTLEVVGSAVNDHPGSIHQNSRKYIREHGWLMRDEVLRKVASADVLICPSRWEGFALAPLEAMSLGVPVIASDATSLPEVVKTNVTGITFPVDDYKRLAEILDGVSADQLKELGVNAQRFVRERFSVDAMRDATYQLYTHDSLLAAAVDEK